ncbi:hypothetical protein [Streptomyces sp. CB03911]|uniref:hypothetical protein n=1 Tax=Streptomyces sp. CB03911 TaxID=1804758 RepID=UPI00093E0139|nr:hypothetical protein [Streptomyces sp. CB03911]OKI19272.1 hypothetical protein A6A07_07160 [Streptomyces sp. CB03911]
MANPSKRLGTDWESALVKYLREHHNPKTHRNVQMGKLDIGDLDGYYLHALEAKNESKITLPVYIAQANREAIHAGQPYGCAVVKKRNAGVAAGYVVRDVETDVRLMNRLRDAEGLLAEAAPTVYVDHIQRHGEGH